MRTDIPELTFPSRADFRVWLSENAETSPGVWLIFGKTKALPTIKAGEALEEALCFGWIDGQMKSIDETKYRKYFAKRRAKSIWSDKNKKLIEILRGKGLMAEPGERAIEVAKQDGSWDIKPVGIEEVEALARMLDGISPAHENFMSMPPSARLACARWYHSVKSEELKKREFAKIVEMLNKNERTTI